MQHEKITFVFPGQGAQKLGMGKDYFDRYPHLLGMAEEVLGYCVKNLCLYDKNNQLGLTQFTQPALYVVNALAYYSTIEDAGKVPDFVAGHSLGEYNALLAANVFDFKTGLILVKKRGELMAQAREGGMAAVIGLDIEQVQRILEKYNLHQIDIANYNSQEQVVISGNKEAVVRAKDFFEKEGCKNYIHLQVSGAFHSRLMQDAQREFEQFTRPFVFQPPRITTIANCTAAPYPKEAPAIRALLVNQIAESVRWAETIQYLMRQGVTSYKEIGVGTVLTNLLTKIKSGSKVKPFIKKGSQSDSLLSLSYDTFPAAPDQPAPPTTRYEAPPVRTQVPAETPYVSPGGRPLAGLGSQSFMDVYQLTYPYVAGGVGFGISSRASVEALARKGMLGFLDITGRPVAETEQDMKILSETLRNTPAVYGCSLTQELDNEKQVQTLFELLKKYHIRAIEVHGDYQIMESLVLYRLQDNGSQSPNRLIVKTSSSDMIQEFLKPAPEHILLKLYNQHKLTREQVEQARKMPFASDICILADPGGTTMHGSPYVLLPYALRLRESYKAQYGYQQPIHLGIGGGLGSPISVAAAFLMGADFVHTTSINLCTREAGLSHYTKNLLQQLEVGDMGYAPSDDFLFESNKKIQVVKKGILFAARANKLYDLFKQYHGLHEIDSKTIGQLEEKLYGHSLATVWTQLETDLALHQPDMLKKALANKKYQMYLLFKQYYSQSIQSAIAGDEQQVLNFQIPCGPALGLLNTELATTPMRHWQDRSVSQLGVWLLEGASEYIQVSSAKVIL